MEFGKFWACFDVGAEVCRGIFPNFWKNLKMILSKIYKSLGKYLGIPRHFIHFTPLLFLFTLISVLWGTEEREVMVN